jgi:uncharacterized membrane protein
MSNQPPYGFPPQGGYQEGGFPPPPQQPRIRFEAIGEAWQLFQKDAGTWVVSALIYFVIVAVVGGVIGVALGLTGEIASRSTGVGDISSLAMPALSLAHILSRIVIFVISTFLLSGMYRMAIKSLRNQPISVGDMFNVGDVLPSCLLAAIIVGILTGIGFILCIIPGIIIGALLMFTYPLIVDRRLGAIDAISQSVNTLKNEILMATLFYLVVGIIVVVGVAACCVGVLVTFPLFILSIAVVYRDFFGAAGQGY